MTCRATITRKLFPSGNLRELDDFDDLIRPTRRPTKVKTGDSDIEAAIDRLSQIHENSVVQSPSANDETMSRTERLQTDLIVDSADRHKQRNDTLFLSKFSSTNKTFDQI